MKMKKMKKFTRNSSRMKYLARKTSGVSFGILGANNRKGIDYYCCCSQ